MFAYDYLKSNPQVRDKQLKFEWASMNDAPFSVRQELKEIALVSDMPSDAVLFWHKYQTMYNLTERKPHYIQAMWWGSHWLELLYLAIKDIEQEQYTYNGFMFLCTVDPFTLKDITLTIEQCRRVIASIHNDSSMRRAFDSYNAYSNECGIYEDILIAITEVSDHIYSINSKMLLDRCSMRMLESLKTYKQLSNVEQLLRDTSTLYVKFDSINQLQAVHDEEAEKKIEELLATKSENAYIYDKRFVEIVKQCGFILPPNEKALAKRGLEHNNCVGNYVARHTMTAITSTQYVTRLVMNGTATAELHCHIGHEMIVAVTIEQYKGKYNKDQPKPKGLSELQIALTGLPMEVVNVKVSTV